MTVLDDVSIDTDVESMIRGAFDELDCCSMHKENIPCGGEVRGYQEYHDCVQGWLCAVHWEHGIQRIALWQKHFDENGSIGCAMCLNRFTNFRNFIKVTPV